MTHNRRYEAIYDEIGRRQIEEMALRPQPLSLTPEEAGLAEHLLFRPAEPIRVRAWVRYPELVVYVLADASGWNDRSVELRWRAPDGSGREALVCASAVRRLGPVPREARDRDLAPWYGHRASDADPQPPGPR
ncbi:hypothetical protein GCM10009840_05490 [Pseudolysinimonas kribbensis]|uniref:Uncharacterized protein n=1 Tax=Pseudolysinimonas kribbensis TaxID=433641 RepID=A0ABQ6K4J8_9MICO|nr:hypothetical protein [Pseudolysinimonas kribbensis]GMA94897.1 hypothetical protein GCM10025881_17210 [Pseudolysinimonas kribbensis]